MEEIRLAEYRDRSQQRQWGALLSYVYSFAQIVVGLLYVPILISGIGQNEYGLYQLIGSIISYLAAMNSVLSGGITRFYCKYYIEGNQLMMENVLATGRSINRFIAVLLIPVTFVIMILVNIGYKSTLTDYQLVESNVMLVVLAVNVVVTMNNIINVAVINANESFAFLKLTQILSIVLQPVLVVVALSFFPFALTVCVIQLFLNILCALSQRIFARKVLNAKVILHHRSKKLYKDLIAFSSTILLVAIADQVFWKTNQIILGYTHGMEIVAVYAIAMQICTSYQPLGTSISSVFMPKISDLYFEKKDLKAIFKLFCSIGRIAGYPLFLVLFGFMVFGQSFIGLWAGEGFEEAYLIALIVMIPLTIDLLQHLGLYILQVMNKYSFRGILFLVMAIVQVVLVLLIVPTFGPLSAACITAVIYLIGNGFIMNLYYKVILQTKISIFWIGILKEFLPMLVFSILFLWIARALSIEFNSWLNLILGIVIFCIMFMVVAYSFSMNNEEKEQLWHFLRKTTFSK